MATRVVFVSDPGRRWLRVPHADISAAGLVDDVSSLSRIDRTHVYLEERRDATRFIAAMHLKGPAIPITRNDTSPIFALPPYTPAGLTAAVNDASDSRRKKLVPR